MRIEITERVVVRRRPNRSNVVAAWTLAVLAALAAFGAVAAIVIAHDNSARRARYADASCNAHLVVLPSGGVCTMDSATVRGTHVSYFRNTPRYFVALATSNAPLDTLEMELPRGVHFQSAWDSLAPGARLVAERFAADSTSPARQITTVRLGDAWIRTQWNPAWREDDAAAGAVFLSLIAIGCAAFAVVLARRNRRAERFA